MTRKTDVALSSAALSLREACTPANAVHEGIAISAAFMAIEWAAGVAPSQPEERDFHARLDRHAERGKRLFDAVFGQIPENSENPRPETPDVGTL